MTTKCSRCKTERSQTYTRSGTRVGTGRYRYPDGYQLKGLGFLDEDGRDAFRLASITRLMPRRRNGSSPNGGDR